MPIMCQVLCQILYMYTIYVILILSMVNLSFSKYKNQDLNPCLSDSRAQAISYYVNCTGRTFCGDGNVQYLGCVIQ